VVTVVRPGDCIATEKKLDLDRICEIAGNFRFDLFCRPSYPKVLVWGCGLLALDGHHRLNAAVEAGEGFVPVGLYPFR